jgi:prepilin-type N-terminal cleavage/methylation domain-containing protein
MRFGPCIRVRARSGPESGFTLIELLVVVAIIAVSLVVTIAVNPQFIRTAKADAGVIQAMEVLRSARETAISKRRNVQVVFTGTNTIETFREDINASNEVSGTTKLRTVTLEGRLEFLLVDGLPDTPDEFGRTTALSFPKASRRFSTEGTFIDASGDPMNGTVFLAVKGEPNSARAITVFGPTGLLRAWRWDGSKWVE